MQLMPGTAEELGVDIDDALENYTGGLELFKTNDQQVWFRSRFSGL